MNALPPVPTGAPEARVAASDRKAEASAKNAPKGLKRFASTLAALLDSSKSGAGDSSPGQVGKAPTPKAATGAEVESKTAATNPAGTPGMTDKDPKSAVAEMGRVRAAIASAMAETATAGAKAAAAASTAAIKAPGIAADATSEAAAAAVRNAANVGDPTRVESSLAALDPEFRARLQRVIDLMASEYGHKVEVVETYRSENRQNYLFEQGRSRPGPIVTWTRDSNHTRGVAADVMVDGSYNNPIGFARLARVAHAEGLKTLGLLDPGHLELGATTPLGAKADAAATASNQTSGPASASVGTTPGALQVAPVAQVARVAQVAQVAPVAEVATVAVPGVAGAKSAQAGGHSSDGDAAGNFDSRDQRLMPFPPSLGGAVAPAPDGDSSSIAPSLGSDAVDRVARVLELQDDAATRPLSQLLLRVENGSGNQDQIRVGLRSGFVGASIDLGNHLNLNPLGQRIDQLRQALEQHGLQLDSLRMGVGQGLSSTTDLGRIAAVAQNPGVLRGQSAGASHDPAPRHERQGQGQQNAGSGFNNSGNRSSREHRQGRDT